MGVLLGLGDVELRPAGLGERLRQRPRLLGAEGDLDRQARLVLGHRHDEDVARRRLAVGARAVEAVERGVGEGVGQLARAVGAEVDVDDRVVVADRALDPVDDRRRDELVGLAPGVGGLDGRGGARRVLPRPRARSRRSRARSGPSAGRGPSPSSGRPTVAIRASGCAIASARLEVADEARAPSSAGCRGRRAARGRAPTGRRARRPAGRARGGAGRWRGPRPARPARPCAGGRSGGPARRRRAAPAARRTSRPRSPRRSGAGPGARAGRRRGSGGRPRSCPSGRAAGRRRPPTPGGRCGASARAARASGASAAAAIASAAGSRPIPKPSSTTRTMGRGRAAGVPRRRPGSVTRRGRGPRR